MNSTAAAKELIVLPNKEKLIATVADRFLKLLETQLRSPKDIHIVLTGGSVGIGVLAGASKRLDSVDIDWYRVHFWWGDDRWLPENDPERNDYQAAVALLDGLGLPPENIHAFPTSDSGLSLEEAASSFNAELLRWAAEGCQYPDFSLCFLGVGPDAHIASLFPNRSAIFSEDFVALSVADSPKPPAERLSFSLPLINSSERVWMVLAGSDKHAALEAALGQADPKQAPASLVQGRNETLIFTDREASAPLSSV
ncbi:MAG: 6-phosphogluconolactonase [Microbacteriaceae bacterium]